MITRSVWGIGLGLTLALAGSPLATAADGPTAVPAMTWEGKAALAAFEPFRERFAQLTSLTATFTQRALGDPLAEDTPETGRLTLEAPRRMRWNYDGAPPRFLVVDGEQVWFVMPADRQVSTEPLAKTRYQGFLQAFFGSKPDLEALLARGGALTRAGDTWTLRLTPAEDTGLAGFTLRWTEGAPWFEGLALTASDGRETAIAFAEVRPVEKPDPTLFTFTAPPGWQVTDFQGNLLTPTATGTTDERR